MFDYSRRGRWLIAATITVASCSQGDAPSLVGPNVVTAAPQGGTAGLLAEGDIKTGTGPLTIEEIRMDRQGPDGASVLRQYANPYGEYSMLEGETIELWVEWVRGGNNAPTNPKLSVDWGDGGPTDSINCGVCLLKHTYPDAGRYTVKVTLDDRAGTTVMRIFYLNSLPPGACVSPALAGEPPDDEICHEENTFDTSVFFTGTHLVYSLQECSQDTSDRVQKMGETEFVEIDSATGIVTTSNSLDYCAIVTATNACGSASVTYAIERHCD